MASRHAWHAMSDDVDAWLERAAALVEHRPASRAKAFVVAAQARRDMLAYRPESGYEAATSAVALAREIEDVEIEADALVTLGCARVSLGDPTGVEDLEQRSRTRGPPRSRRLPGAQQSRMGVFGHRRPIACSSCERGECCSRDRRKATRRKRGSRRGTSPTSSTPRPVGRGDAQRSTHSTPHPRAPATCRPRFAASGPTSLRPAIVPRRALEEIRDVVAISRPIDGSAGTMAVARRASLGSLSSWASTRRRRRA